MTASFGSAGEGGDAYYLNKDTGETVWDKPDDYVEDEAAVVKRRRRVSLAQVTESTTLREGIELLNIFGTSARQEDLLPCARR